MSEKLPTDFAQRAQMGLGAQGADRTWDNLIRYHNDAYFAGFMTRMFALHAAQVNPEQTLRILDACRTGLESMKIIKEHNNG